MKTNSLLIYQKYTELFYYTYDLLKKYPKSETFTLAAEIKNNLFKGHKLLMYAMKIYSSKDKIKYLNELDISLSLLKFQIRLSFKYKYITNQNYETWAKHVSEVNNMLGGWINSCLKR